MACSDEWHISTISDWLSADSGSGADADEDKASAGDATADGRPMVVTLSGDGVGPCIGFVEAANAVPCEANAVRCHKTRATTAGEAALTNGQSNEWKQQQYKIENSVS